MKKPWKKALLKPVLKEEEFATRNLYLAADELNSLLEGFLKHVNTVECSFRKHFIKVVETTLRVKIGEDLELGFNDKKAEESGIERFVFKKLREIADVFYSSIQTNDPEYFQKEKKVWLKNFNSQFKKINIKRRSQQ